MWESMTACSTDASNHNIIAVEALENHKAFFQTKIREERRKVRLPKRREKLTASGANIFLQMASWWVLLSSAAANTSACNVSRQLVPVFLVTVLFQRGTLKKKKKKNFSQQPSSHNVVWCTAVLCVPVTDGRRQQKKAERGDEGQRPESDGRDSSFCSLSSGHEPKYRPLSHLKNGEGRPYLKQAWECRAAPQGWSGQKVGFCADSGYCHSPRGKKSVINGRGDSNAPIPRCALRFPRHIMRQIQNIQKLTCLVLQTGPLVRHHIYVQKQQPRLRKMGGSAEG